MIFWILVILLLLFVVALIIVFMFCCLFNLLLVGVLPGGVVFTFVLCFVFMVVWLVFLGGLLLV